MHPVESLTLLPLLDSASEVQCSHPLEPLSAAEIQQAVSLLRQLGKVTPSTRFVSVRLKEPRKDAVHDA